MLFSTKEIKPPEEKETINITNSSNSDFNVFGLKHFKTFADDNANENLFFETSGKYSLHQIIKILIDDMNGADLFITTWGLSEEPVRTLLKLKQQGKINQLVGLFSERVKERQPKPYQLAESIFDKLKLTKLHAKVVVLISENKQYTILSSMNLTRNPRSEAGVVSKTKKIADEYSSWINNQS